MPRRKTKLPKVGTKVAMKVSHLPTKLPLPTWYTRTGIICWVGDDSAGIKFGDVYVILRHGNYVVKGSVK